MLVRATYLVFCFIAICAAEISACTVFYAADGDTVLVGNNEDYFNPRTKIWLYPAEKGRYGRVYFGWENEYDNFPMGGMNDQGLFFDWLAVPPFSLGPDKEKDSVHVASAFAKKMMETCSTVEEAVRLHKTIDKSGRWPAVAIVGDAMGNCTLIEGDQYIKKGANEKYFVATNFRQSITQPAERTCPRYQLVRNMLSSASAFTVELFRKALFETHAETPGATLYSNIYDLKKRTVLVYHFHDFEEHYLLDLDKELRKGEQVIDLPSLFKPSIVAQSYQNGLSNSEPLASPHPVRSLQEYVGKYGSEDYFVEIKLRGEDLWAEPSIGLRCEMVPIDDDQFRICRLGTTKDLEFLSDRRGEIALLLVRMNGRTIDLRKQQEATPRVPASISEEAQEFLKQGPALPTKPPTNLKEWRERREEMEVLGRSWYEASRHKYSGPAEVLTVKGNDGQRVRVHKMTPENFSAENAEKAILHLHGGGYCFMSPESTYCVCAPVANLTGLCVYCVDYRLAPEHPFPAAVNDCVTAYKAIIKKVRPENLCILGESAGASLSLTMLLKARDEQLPMPAVVACISPCVDLTMSGDTIETLEGLDPVLSPRLMKSFQGAYIGAADVRDPLLSPLFADYTPEFPPTIIQTGTRDLLLSDCVRMHQKLKSAGVDAELSVREGMWHGYHIIPDDEFPEAKAGFQELADFIEQRLNRDAAALDISPEAQQVIAEAQDIPAHLRGRGGIIKRRTTEQLEQLQADFHTNWKTASERLCRECKANVKSRSVQGVDVIEITPHKYSRKRDKYVILWIHGGGFVLGSPDSAWGGGVRVAAESGIRVLSVGYRLAPQHRFPAGLNDCVTVYRELLKDYQASNIGVYGGSAGGNLVLSMVLRARSEGLPLPAAVAVDSPWADLTKTGDSYNTLIGKDPVLHSYEATEWCVHAYLDEGTDWKAPLVSPVYGIFQDGFSPTLIQTGTRDVFLSSCVRLHRKMKNSGVDAELSVWEGMWHGFADEGFREARDAKREVAEFFLKQFKIK